MSTVNLLGLENLDEKPVRGSPARRPKPKPRKRQEIFSREKEDEYEETEQSKDSNISNPKPKPRRRVKQDSQSQDDLSMSSVSSVDRNFIQSTVAFDNPVFEGDDDVEKRQIRNRRKSHQQSEDQDSSSPSHSERSLASHSTKKNLQKKQPGEFSKNQRDKRYKSKNEDETSVSEEDGYLYIENEVEEPSEAKLKRSSVLGQFISPVYSSPKITTFHKNEDKIEIVEELLSPKKKKKVKKNSEGHVSIQIESEKDVEKNHDEKDDSEKKISKSSKGVGGIVGRWKNFLTKSSSGSILSKTQVETKDKPQKEFTREEEKGSEKVKSVKELSTREAQKTKKEKDKKSKESKRKNSKDHTEIEIVSKNKSSEDESEHSIVSKDNFIEMQDLKQDRNTKGKQSPKLTKSRIKLKEIKTTDLLQEKFKSIKTKSKQGDKSKETSKDLIHFEDIKSQNSEEIKEHLKHLKFSKPLQSKITKERSKKLPIVDSLGKDLLFGITIHSSDLLPLDPNIIHPVVKLTVMRQDGSLIRRTKDTLPTQSSQNLGIEEINERKKRRRRERKEHEEEISPLNSISPIMTQPFKMTIKNTTFCPTWNELLLFEEPFQKFTKEHANVILFFEIMDFLPMEKCAEIPASGNHGSEAGWYKIAWAFLKPVGKNGILNVEKRLRLQLYKPMKLKSKDKKNLIDPIEVFSWWKSEKKEKLTNTTLYVTVKGVNPPTGTKASLKQLLSMRKEELTEAIIESQLSATKQTKKLKRKQEQNKENGDKSEKVIMDKRKQMNWTRLEGQSCKVPNKLIASLPSSQIQALNITVSGNVYCLKFSPCGLKLAAGFDTEEMHAVLIFEIPSFRLLKSLKNHHGLIYDLDWKQMDIDNNTYIHYLASASADSTAVVWRMKNHDESTMSMVKTLLHPSFVYCVKFHPTHPSLVVTGCFDCIIRVWSLSNKEEDNLESHHEKKGLRYRRASHDSCPLFILDRHNGFVNSLVFDKTGSYLFSGDSDSCVYKWSIKSPAKRKSWKIDRDARVTDHRKVPINSLALHGNRLLVHLRDNCMKILEASSLITIQTISGLVNDKLQIRSCFSPCGNLILSGSENPTICIWDADTSAILQFMSPTNHPNCYVTSIDYHPFDFYMAVGLASSFSEPSPVLLYGVNQTNLQTVATIQTSVAKFKSNLRKSQSRSLEEHLNTNVGARKSVSFAPRLQIGDSSEKFTNILNKLDKALKDAQEPKRIRPNSSYLSRSTSLDFAENTTNIGIQRPNSASFVEKSQSNHNEYEISPKKPERKSKSPRTYIEDRLEELLVPENQEIRKIPEKSAVNEIKTLQNNHQEDYENDQHSKLYDSNTSTPTVQTNQNEMEEKVNHNIQTKSTIMIVAETEDIQNITEYLSPKNLPKPRRNVPRISKVSKIPVRQTSEGSNKSSPSTPTPSPPISPNNSTKRMADSGKQEVTVQIHVTKESSPVEK